LGKLTCESYCVNRPSGRAVNHRGSGLADAWVWAWALTMTPNRTLAMLPHTAGARVKTPLLNEKLESDTRRA